MGDADMRHTEVVPPDADIGTTSLPRDFELDTDRSVAEGVATPDAASATNARITKNRGKIIIAFGKGEANKPFGEGSTTDLVLLHTDPDRQDAPENGARARTQMAIALRGHILRGIDIAYASPEQIATIRKAHDILDQKLVDTTHPIDQQTANSIVNSVLLELGVEPYREREDPFTSQIQEAKMPRAA